MAEEKSKPDRKYDAHQHAMLAYCLYKGDFSPWNDWRKGNAGVPIMLDGGDFKGCWLRGANLRSATLRFAVLRNANLDGACLRSADLYRADLKSARLWYVDLRNAKLEEADLQDTWLKKASLQSADFKLARVNGETSITGCEFDKDTDFTGVGFDATTIDPELKTAFKDNIRRIHWKTWIDEELKKGWRNSVLARLVRLFWWMSNYGSSTRKIIGTFFGLAVFFCLLYWAFAVIPGSKSIIEELRQVDGQPAFGFMHSLVRSLYFSIVTMTTLGFGDMHAAKTGGWASYLGYLFLSAQVILGYVILGALITRLGILFISEAPAAEPRIISDTDKGTDES